MRPPPAILKTLPVIVQWWAILAEGLFGAWLMAGLIPRATRIVAIAVFGGMLVVATREALSGAATCGCFGAVHTSPWIVATFDLIAVLGLVLVPSAKFGISSFWRSAVFALSLGLGLILSPTRGSALALEPETWVGKPLPILDQIEGGTSLAYGDWLVVFYRYDCPHCQAALREIEASAEGDPLLSAPQQVLLIEVGPPFATEPAVTQWAIHKQMVGDVLVVPKLVSVHDGVVTYVRDG